MPNRINLRLVLGLILAVIGIISYFSQTSVNPTTGEKQHVSLSVDQETQLGLQSAPEMANQMGGEVPASDPRAQLVSKVGNKVLSNSSASKSPYHYDYHLLADNQTVNAFALPGGQVFITLGLLTKLDDEAELAGVLGHETGHVVERHSAQQMSKGQLGQTLAMAVGVAASDRGNGYTAAMLANFANQMIQLRYSREDESQADACGLRFMTEAGYDPRAMIDVMKILQQVSGSGHQPEFLATHPDPGNRIQAIQQWLHDHPDLAPTLTRGQRFH